jgi:hypothetical protein
VQNIFATRNININVRMEKIIKGSPAKRKALELSKMDIVPFLIWVIVVFLTWTFMHGADHFLKLIPEALGKYYTLRWVLIAHITAGGGALILGIIQFWPKLRSYSGKLHRLIGLLYLLAILVSSICAMILAFTTAYTLRWPYAFSLQVWSGVWISSTFIAYYTALKKRYKSHQVWMTRSYIVTIAFLISGLAFKSPIVQQLGSVTEIFPPLIWMGWALPLYVYEIIRSSQERI